MPRNEQPSRPEHYALPRASFRQCCNQQGSEYPAEHLRGKEVYSEGRSISAGKCTCLLLLWQRYLFGLLRGKLGQLKNTVCSCGNRVQMCKILNCISEKPFTVCNIFEAEGEPCKEKANRSQQEQKADQSLRIFALYSETSKAVQCNFHVRPPPVSDHRSKHQNVPSEIPIVGTPRKLLPLISDCDHFLGDGSMIFLCF